MNPSPCSASLFVFDWQGPDFLTFYTVAFLIAMASSLIRSRSLRRRFEQRGVSPGLSDPYDAAYLAGGRIRVLQLAVARLLKLNLLTWTNTARGAWVCATDQAPPVDEMKPIEQLIHERVKASSEGMSLAEISAVMGSTLSAIEARLAKGGLRPTIEESAGNEAMICWPMVVVMAMGVVKVMIGISRNKPVGFLVFGLMISLGIVCMLWSRESRRIGRPTRCGEEMLQELRERSWSGASDFQAWSMGVAVFGPMMLSGLMQDRFTRDQLMAVERLKTKSSGDGGSGCGVFSGCGGGSSGCGGGSSGCGGGGCGGCGGD